MVITCMSSISALTLFNSFNKPLLFLVEFRLGETAVVDIVLISFDVFGLIIPENILSSSSIGKSIAYIFPPSANIFGGYLFC